MISFEFSQKIHWVRITRHGLLLIRFSSKNAVQVVKKKSRSKQPYLHRNHDVVKHVNEILTCGSSEQANMLEQVKDTFLHNIRTQNSQILGFSLDEIKKRSNLFSAVGISKPDSLILSLSIPACVHVNNVNFKKVLLLLKQYDLPVEELFFNHPHIGAYDHRQVERNLHLLSQVHGRKTNLSSLISDCPMLLAFILNKDTVKYLEKALFCLGNGVMQDNIRQSLSETAVNNKGIEKFVTTRTGTQQGTAAKEFLAMYEISQEKMYLLCPEFFLAPQATLDLCVKNVSSAPFFFGAEDIEKLLNNFPCVFLSFEKQILLKQAKYIDDVAATKTRAYKILLDTPEVFQDPQKFFERVGIFEKYGIKDGDIGRLLAQKGGTNCFVDCKDFTDESIANILEFYKSKNDISPLQIVVSAPISLSLKSQDIIKSRLSFLRHKEKVNILLPRKKKKKSQVTIQSIVREDLEEFVKNVCKASLEEYEEFCTKNKLRNYNALYQNL